ncbi:MAG: hypothetical protein ACW99J_17885 [Candidatus Thorarchaeota archaeon]|jgi:hypothetical protein
MNERTAMEAAESPRRDDVWESSSGLVRLRVTNGRWRGLVTYTYKFAGDPEKRRNCHPWQWAGRVSGMRYKGTSKSI